MIDCPYCSPGVTQSLDILPTSNKEYQQTLLTMDGTKKWFYCNNCTGVYCFDKMRGIWQFSPDTYTKFLNEGKIIDRLS